MVAIPTVKSFCGCCDLKVACVVIASLRIIGSIIVILIYSFLFFLLGTDSIKSETENRAESGSAPTDGVIEVLLYVWLIIQCVVGVVNILCSYWFIRGVTSVKYHHIESRNVLTFFFYFPQKKPSKMKYYVMIVAVDVIVYLLQFDIVFFILAVIEAYIFICSYSLYVVCLNSFQEDGVNTTEHTVMKNEIDPPPPPYNSCENDMQGQTAGLYPKQYP